MCFNFLMFVYRSLMLSDAHLLMTSFEKTHKKTGSQAFVNITSVNYQGKCRRWLGQTTQSKVGLFHFQIGIPTSCRNYKEAMT